MAEPDDRSATIIPLRPAISLHDHAVRELARVAHSMGTTLSELVATADAHGLKVPNRVRLASDLLLEGQFISDQEPSIQPVSGTDAMRRREMVGALLGTAVGVLLPPEGLAAGPRLGAADVRRWHQTLGRLYELDDQYGGAGGVYDLTVRSLQRLRRSLQRSTFGGAIGNALHSIAGTLTDHAGWLAIDAGRQADARFWWLEALHYARLAEDNDVTTLVMASMSLQASTEGRPSEAVELAQAAQETVRSRPTPRLWSVLLAREARGHARTGDAHAAARTLQRATVQLDGEPHDDDPPWLEFWGEADLTCHEMFTATDIGDLAAAERAARIAVASADQTSIPATTPST